MKTKTAAKDKINIITLGCSKNTVDSEVLMSQLRANKLPVSHESGKNDYGVVIINTCGFIENAKQESIDTIIHFAKEKQKGNIKKLIVTGCLSERYKPELEKEIPDADHYFGTRDLPRLLKVLGADYRHELVGERVLTTPSHYAYMKISEGCDRPCSFCAIPLMRGAHVSKPMEELVKEAKHLAKNGTKELVIIAQDSTYYGLDIYKKRKLAELLQRLSDVNGIEWIRLHYAFPAGFPEDVLEVMREKNNICKYIDMPIQHVSNNMLTSMRRGITKQKITDLVNKIRDKVPGIAIRTTLIAGYPGETKKDHDELLEFINEAQFERLGVFAYSHEEDTAAYALKDNVPPHIKEERVASLMQAQQIISERLNAQKTGKILKVLFDRKEGNYFVGRTEHDSPEVDNEVLAEAPGSYVRLGDFADVKIERAEAFDLFGRVMA